LFNELKDKVELDAHKKSVESPDGIDIFSWLDLRPSEVNFKPEIIKSEDYFEENYKKIVDKYKFQRQLIWDNKNAKANGQKQNINTKRQRAKHKWNDSLRPPLPFRIG
jgi:hypothetical protein